MSRALGLAVAVLVGVETLAQPGVVVTGAADTVNISIVKRVNVGYYLVTSDRPLEFEVTSTDSLATPARSGGRLLRVYTRLWWTDRADSERTYRMSLRQGDVERLLEFRTRLSASSRAMDGHTVGEWRSFRLEVPAAGARHCLSSPYGDTVAVRFTFPSPRSWFDVPLPGQRRLCLRPSTTNRGRPVLRADSAAAIRYLVAVGETVPFRVDGPGSIRVRVRLSRVPRMTGPRAFTLTVYERGQELLRRELQVARSARVICADLPGAALSTERVVSVRPATGSGELSLCVSGTTAKSALVGVEYLPAEKYEE